MSIENLKDIVAFFLSVVVVGVASGWTAILAYKNYKKSSSDSDRDYQSDQFREAVDRQLDVHKEEVKIATDKLNDAINQVEKDKQEMSKMRKQMHNMYVEYEKKINSLKQEIRYLKNKLSQKLDNEKEHK